MPFVHSEHFYFLDLEVHLTIVEKVLGYHRVFVQFLWHLVAGAEPTPRVGIHVAFRIDTDGVLELEQHILIM